MNGFKWPGRRHVAAETPTQFAERLERVHADPRLVHTTETSASEPAREAGVDEKAQAAMEALRARVAAAKVAPVAPPVRPVREAVVDRDELVRRQIEMVLAERERREVVAAARAELKRREAQARGGPCQFCGLTMSWEPGDDGEPVGRWYDDGKTCTWCDSDRIDFPGPTGKLSDLEHRVRVLTKYVVPGTGWRGQYLLDRCRGFRWWRDTPGAATVQDSGDRFAYVDRAALAAVLEPPPVRYETREPCRRCGVPDRWVLTRGYSGFGHTATAVESWKCTACNDASDPVWLICRFTGLAPWKVESLGTAAAGVFGVGWWADDAAGGSADPPQPCATAFAYIDQAAARRAAWRLFQRERDYGNPAFWQAARDAAGA